MGYPKTRLSPLSAGEVTELVVLYYMQIMYILHSEYNNLKNSVCFMKCKVHIKNPHTESSGK
jgi:hypothetical protein